MHDRNDPLAVGTSKQHVIAVLAHGNRTHRATLQWVAWPDLGNKFAFEPRSIGADGNATVPETPSKTYVRQVTRAQRLPPETHRSRAPRRDAPSTSHARR